MGLSTGARDLANEIKYFSIEIRTGIENMGSRYDEKECHGNKWLHRVRKCVPEQKSHRICPMLENPYWIILLEPVASKKNFRFLDSIKKL